MTNRYRRSTRALVVALLAITASGLARAQCPDGSPPPCRSVTVAMAPRRVNPPLDERTWIVVPFDNLAKAADVDWLRSASVNLLYLGMSRWTDVRVIDDERVADFLRETPEAKAATSLSLSAGLAVAKRAGAGKLVMGDVLKLGNRTTVTAKVFEVKTGQRLRSVREETAIQDSVLPMFGKLAQKVLDVPASAGANIGVAGTTNIQAFQAYVQGMNALNVFDLAKARASFERALQLDSTFALAHAKLSVLGGWDNPNDPANRSHAEAAARLSASLPPRERALVQAQVTFARHQYAKACEAFGNLVRADSTDVDAWYGLGDCAFHNDTLVAVNGDSTRLRWYGDLNASIRAFQRALEIDPTYHLAYSHVVDAYSMQLRGGKYCVDNKCTPYVALVRPSGDSLLVVPVAIPRDTAVLRAHFEDYVRSGARKRMLERAQSVAANWVAANPSEQRARLMNATVLLLAGRPAAADSQLARTNLGGDTYAGALAAFSRLETAIKLWQGRESNRLYDSLRASRVTLGQAPGRGAVTVGSAAGGFGPVLGRVAELDSIVQSMGSPPVFQRLSWLTIRIALLSPPDTAAAMERALFDQVVSMMGPKQATAIAGGTFWLGLRLPRNPWPALDTTATNTKLQAALAVARGDTARLRRAAHRLDSLSSVYQAALVPDTGAALVAADAYLILYDSLTALRLTRRTLDTAVAFTSMSGAQTAQTLIQILVPRAMVMRADLAAALGQKDEARLWYKRFLDFWAKPDAELQPLVERVRKSYAAIGGT